MVEYLEGMLKISNLFLSLVAGYIALTIISMSSKKKLLVPWKILSFALIFFAIQEILGVLRAFNIYSSSYLTHIVPTVILGLLIFCLTLQINLYKK